MEISLILLYRYVNHHTAYSLIEERPQKNSTTTATGLWYFRLTHNTVENTIFCGQYKGKRFQPVWTSLVLSRVLSNANTPIQHYADPHFNRFGHHRNCLSRCGHAYWTGEERRCKYIHAFTDTHSHHIIIYPQEAAPTISLCTGYVGTGCISVPVVSDTCVNFTGGLTFLNKEVTSVVVPGGFACTFTSWVRAFL